MSDNAVRVPLTTPRRVASTICSNSSVSIDMKGEAREHRRVHPDLDRAENLLDGGTGARDSAGIGHVADKAIDLLAIELLEFVETLAASREHTYAVTLLDETGDHGTTDASAAACHDGDLLVFCHNASIRLDRRYHLRK